MNKKAKHIRNYVRELANPDLPERVYDNKTRPVVVYKETGETEDLVNPPWWSRGGSTPVKKPVVVNFEQVRLGKCRRALYKKLKRIYQKRLRAGYFSVELS